MTSGEKKFTLAWPVFVHVADAVSRERTACAFRSRRLNLTPAVWRLPQPEATESAERLLADDSASAPQIPAIEISSPQICDLAPERAAAESEIKPTEPELPSAAGSALPESLVDPEPRPAPLPRPKAQRKVIAFPHQASGAPDMVHRLADPVLPEQPRILDVPEELEAFATTPFLDGLQFGPNTQPVIATHADNVELPARPADKAHRLYAACVDGIVVVTSTAVFAATGYKMLPNLVFTKPTLSTAAALPFLLWAVYQYLMLVYGGATAGMCAAKIRLSTFKGKSPSRRERRQRVLALYFSTASLLMGLLWGFVDVDTLCWHDRISRTYLIDRK